MHFRRNPDKLFHTNGEICLLSNFLITNWHTNYFNGICFPRKNKCDTFDVHANSTFWLSLLKACGAQVSHRNIFKRRNFSHNMRALAQQQWQWQRYTKIAPPNHRTTQEPHAPRRNLIKLTSFSLCFALAQLRLMCVSVCQAVAESWVLSFPIFESSAQRW